MDSPSQKPWLTLNRSQVLNARITQLQSTGAASQSVASVVEDLNDYYERGTLQIAPTQNFRTFWFAWVWVHVIAPRHSTSVDANWDSRRGEEGTDTDLEGTVSPDVADCGGRVWDPMCDDVCPCRVCSSRVGRRAMHCVLESSHDCGCGDDCSSTVFTAHSCTSRVERENTVGRILPKGVLGTCQRRKWISTPSVIGWG